MTRSERKQTRVQIRMLHRAANQCEDRQYPKALEGLAAEARKCNTFEEFESDFIRNIKHGRYYHVTSDPNFFIDPSKGPSDKSSMSDGGVDVGKLMITSHLENWTDYYGKSRPYVAVIDMSAVPRNAYYQVNRGFGNEFFVGDPSKAKVIKVVTVAQAKADNRYYDSFVKKTFHGSEDLENFYNTVKGIVPADTKTAAYTAYVLTDASRDLLLSKFPPKFPDVIAHHITINIGVKKDAPIPEAASSSNAFDDWGGWILRNGTEHGVSEREADDEGHDSTARRLGYNGRIDALSKGAIRVDFNTISTGTYFEVQRMDDNTRRLLKDAIFKAYEPIMIEWWSPEEDSANFNTKEEAIDWLEHRTVFASARQTDQGRIQAFNLRHEANQLTETLRRKS